MSEKASRNEGADEANDPAKDLPGIPVGEEIALGPVEGEEIDPLPKWWDEPVPTEKNKAGNRRIEDGIDFETPRRKKPMPRFEEGDLDLPAMETGTKPREELPEMPVSAAGGKKLGFDGIPDDAKIEVPAEVKPAAEEGKSLPEIEFALKPLKRHRHSGEEVQEADLDGFFSDTVLEEQPKSAIPVKSSSEDALPEMVIVDLDLPDLPKKSAVAAVPTPPPIPLSEPIEEPVIEPAVVAVAPRKAGPPPLPAAVASTVQAPEPVVEVLEESAAKDAAVPEVLPVVEIEKAGEPVENEEPMENELAIAAVEVPAVIDEDVVSAVADEPIAQTAEHVSEAKDESIEAPATADILPSPDKTPNETEPAVEEKPAEPAPVPVIGGPLPVAAAAETIAAPAKKKAGCWAVFTTLFFFAALLVLVALGGAAAYAWSKLGDFEKEITALATTKLADQGIHLDHGEWSYAFPRGVVFDEVTLFDDARPILERASARETAARVALGALGRAFLRQVGGIDVISHVVRIGAVAAPGDSVPTEADRERVDADPVRALDAETSQRMQEEIASAHRDGDTLGGVVEVVVTGLPPGLGSHVHWDRRIDARLAAALMGIQAIKGVEVGDGFDLAARRGSQAQDEIVSDGGRLTRTSGRSGGTEGGMTTGETLRVRAAMKPISTIPRALQTVDVTTGEAAKAINQRSDVCAVPAAGIVAEAMVTLVLVDAIMEKFGGDSLGETRRNLLSYLEHLAIR